MKSIWKHLARHHRALAALSVPVILTMTTTTAMMGLQKAGLSHTPRASWACVLRTVVRCSLRHAGNDSKVYRHPTRLENRSKPRQCLTPELLFPHCWSRVGPQTFYFHSLEKHNPSHDCTSLGYLEPSASFMEGNVSPFHHTSPHP